MSSVRHIAGEHAFDDVTSNVVPIHRLLVATNALQSTTLGLSTPLFTDFKWSPFSDHFWLQDGANQI